MTTPRTRPEQIALHDRDTAAVRMRAAGRTYSEIARELDYSTPNAACKAVLRTIDRTEAEAVDEMRAVELAHLDELRARTMTAIEQSARSEFGLAPQLINAAVRISERRARIAGIDRPLGYEPTETGPAIANIRETTHALMATFRANARAEITDELRADIRAEVLAEIDAETVDDEDEE